MRPISEKGPIDKVHETQFAVRQLQRRPAPPTVGPPIRFRARRKTTFQTLGASGAETDLEWNLHENDDTSVWSAYDSGGGLVTSTTGTFRSVTLAVPALVVMGGCISVQTIATVTDAQLVIVINDGYDSPELVVHPKQFAGAGGMYSFTSTRSYPVIDPVDNPDGEASFSIDAAQNGGTDRNTQFGTYWELAAFIL